MGKAKVFNVKVLYLCFLSRIGLVAIAGGVFGGP